MQIDRTPEGHLKITDKGRSFIMSKDWVEHNRSSNWYVTQFERSDGLRGHIMQGSRKEDKNEYMVFRGISGDRVLGEVGTFADVSRWALNIA